MESIRISRDFLGAYLLAAALLASTLSLTSGDLKPVGQGAVGALLPSARVASHTPGLA